MSDSTLFVSKSPWIMQGLIREFGLTDIQAAGILGNIGHECNGFHQMQEGQPIGGGRGGYGWCQWTGSRRTQFEDYAAQRGLDVDGDKANFGFLVWELHNTESAAIKAVRGTASLGDAVRAFESKFERANPLYKHYESRDKWAQTALNAFASHDFGIAEAVSGIDSYHAVAGAGEAVAAGGGAMGNMPAAAAGAPSFAQKLAEKARNEEATYHGLLEGQSPLKERINVYWTHVGMPWLDGSNHEQPWSAAFISYMAHLAGAGSSFHASAQHSQYIYRAINDRIIDKKTAFWGYPVGAIEIAPGDIIGMNRATAAHIDFDWASHHSDYKSHADIVVAVDGSGIHTIGGNVGAAPGQVGKKRFIRQGDALVNGASPNQRVFVVIRSFLP